MMKRDAYDNASKSARLFSMHSMKRSMLELQVVFFQIAPTIVYSAQSLKGTKIKGSSKTDFTELTVTGIPGEVNAYGEIDPISFISSSICKSDAAKLSRARLVA